MILPDTAANVLALSRTLQMLGYAILLTPRKGGVWEIRAGGKISVTETVRPNMTPEQIGALAATMDRNLRSLERKDTK